MPTFVMGLRDYAAALEALSSLITKRTRGDGSNRGDAFDLMSRYVKVAGFEEPLSKLKIIHVAGTKGKGSTCSFSESILRECGYKTGLFTSPHLIDVRERFKVNKVNVPEDVFLKHFWWCWDLFKENITNDVPMPTYFRFLTLLAFRIFIDEKVDVAILEVGLGGRFDSTNVVKQPAVCGITSLGFDHMEILGNTLPEIAAEKAGILKPGVLAFTVPQPEEAMDVLRKRASELDVTLLGAMVDRTLSRIGMMCDCYAGGQIHESRPIVLTDNNKIETSLSFRIRLQVIQPLTTELMRGSQLGLEGEHQFVNASLAVALCRAWAERCQEKEHVSMFETAIANGHLPEPYIRGLATAQLLGRAQKVHDPIMKSLTFFLDGAHSPESMEICARWFCSSVQRSNDTSGEQGSDSEKILVMNCMPQRDPNLLLPPLVNTCNSYGLRFQHAMFVPGLSSYTRVSDPISNSANASIDNVDLSWQSTIKRVWDNLTRSKNECLNENQAMEPTSVSCSGNSKEARDIIDGLQSSIVSSLPVALDLIRKYAREHPGLHLQVLVTGSLHLVGDLLRILK